jgi:uncharacterized protein (TIGR02594 family)
MSDTGPPPWLLTMRTITGVTETPGAADNPKILAMRDEIARHWASTPGMAEYTALYHHDSIPWCGLTVAYAMTMADIHPVFGPTDTDRYLWAKAWDDPSFGQKISSPRVGCVVVMGREGGGHVSLYERTEGSYYYCRGGNQSDAITLQKYPISNVISLVWPKAAGDLPPPPRRTLEKGDKGEDVTGLQHSLGLPAQVCDGDFGSVTEAAVKGFQSGHGLTADGIVGPMTWEEVDANDARVAAGSEGLAPELVEAITTMVSKSDVASYVWKGDRGRAPKGYTEGVALTYALVLLDLAEGVPAAVECAQAMRDDADTDALKWYEKEYAALGMDNSVPGVDTLRHLFVMLLGLGMRESSGRYFCGRDTTATNITADTCEAGAWQQSWNIKSASPSMGALFKQYQLDPNGFLEVFQQGLSPTSSDLLNAGSGEGVTFQWLCKFAPSFAAYTCALGLRLRRKHWGPINRKEAEILQSANELFRLVEELVGRAPEPEPEPEPEPGVSTVDIVTTGPVVVTINGVVIGS